MVGKVFWSGALSAVEDLPRWTVEEQRHGLEWKEFVRRERRSQVSAETEYAFRHVLVRDVAYGQISRGRRADKHRAVAEWIAQLAPDRHFSASWRPPASSRSLARQASAGRRIWASFTGGAPSRRSRGDRAGPQSSPARPRARTRARSGSDGRASPRSPRLVDPERGHLLLRYGKARYHIDPSLEVIEEARDRLLAAGEQETAAEAEVTLGSCSSTAARLIGAGECLDNALALVTDTGSTPAKARVLAVVSRRLIFGTEAAPAIRAAEQALAIADELGLDEIRAAALNNIGVVRVHSGDAGGKADLERSIAIALEANSPEIIRGYVNLADVHERFGDLKRTFELRREGGRAADRFGHLFPIRWLEGERVSEDYWCGRWDDAVAGATRFIAEVEAGSPHYLESPCREARARISAARGDLRAALVDSDKELDGALGSAGASCASKRGRPRARPQRVLFSRTLS